MNTPASLVIRTQDKYRSLTTKHAYKKGDVICPIPTATVYDKPNRFTVQIGRDRHVEVKELASMKSFVQSEYVFGYNSNAGVRRT